MNSLLSRLPAVCVLATGLLVGCGGGGGGGLSDPGLSNVKVETRGAGSAVIGFDGGEITATGSNGIVYKLTIPQGAIQNDTRISLYPVTSLSTMPAGKAIVAGVHFTPEGLKLAPAATLTMQLPATIDASQLTGLTYIGNGEQLH